MSRAVTRVESRADPEYFLPSSVRQSVIADDQPQIVSAIRAAYFPVDIIDFEYLEFGRKQRFAGTVKR